MNENTVRVSEKNDVVTVTLNRPERRNAFNPEMIRRLTEVFHELERRDGLRAIIFRGEGKSFSAGGDLEWMNSMINYSSEENLKDARQLFDMFSAIMNCSHPVLAVVQGHAMGGGLGLVAVSDVVFATEDTQFSFSEARLGIAPAVISPFVLRKGLVGKLREVMLTAKVFGADLARDLGLVHHIGTAGEIERALHDTLLALGECAPGAVREAKKLLNFIVEQPWGAARDRSAGVIAERRVSAEGQEGLRAFLEKRTPTWRRGAP